VVAGHSGAFPEETVGADFYFLHHTCTTMEWHLRSRTVAIGQSEMRAELPKYTSVLFRVRQPRTFAS
jgi:hypothetical protein